MRVRRHGTGRGRRSAATGARAGARPGRGLVREGRRGGARGGEGARQARRRGAAVGRGRDVAGSSGKAAEEGAAVSHPVLEGKPNTNHVRARISYSRTQRLHK
jgi:hypothetical protein